MLPSIRSGNQKGARRRGAGGAILYRETVETKDSRAIVEGCYQEPQWTADAWHLERSDPDQWGRRERYDLQLQVQALVAKISAEFGLPPERLLAEAQALIAESRHSPASEATPAMRGEGDR